MLSAILAGLRFYSRLPVPVSRWERDPHALPDFARVAPVLPVVGSLLAVLPAVGLWVGQGAGPVLAATLCVAVAVVTTGAFHEDGLADTADSFGAATPERRLEIMRDSRIGTFGAAALVLVLLARVLAIAQLVAGHDLWTVVAALLIIGGLSRTAPLVMLVALPPARQGGLSYAVGLPSRRHVLVAWVVGIVLATVLALSAALPGEWWGATLGTSLAVGALAVPFARRHVGGHTGDVSGACQQVAEVGTLFLLAALA